MTTKVAPLFVWREEYSIHQPEIDRQHQKLVGYLNSLYEAMMEGRSNQEMGKLLADLVQYTLVHFRDEERLMQMHNYPAFHAHHAAHADLERQVAEFQNRLRNGRVTLSLDLLKFLKSWLQHHIQGSDQEFGRYLAAKKLN
jgi:hemerythrin-like metal-binding protein